MASMTGAGWSLISKGNGPWYFIPDWDDYVDPVYDFISDVSMSKGWEHQSYAHELLGGPVSDGLLVSRAVIESSKARRKRLDAHGVHGMLRVPDSFPVMGDCGAFDYISEKEPRYTPEDVFRYYTRHGFDFGVSVDHLIPGSDHPDRQYRYDVTLRNAERFMELWNREKPDWVPVGAVQGWDPDSYAAAARRVYEMGYPLIGLGGLVRSSTKEILSIISAVHSEVPDARLHLFGVARETMFRELRHNGVFSVDSAASLRKAWLSSTDNYLTMDGTSYCAIRVPYARGGRGPMRSLSPEDLEKAETLEKDTLNALRAYDRGEKELTHVIEIIEEYEKLYSPKTSRIGHYRRTLEDRPWKKCTCAICQKHGIEVVIFRGNNRNRRRGFHNTWTFYRRWQKMRDSISSTEM